MFFILFLNKICFFLQLLVLLSIVLLFSLLFIVIFRSVGHLVIGCLASLDWVKTSLAVLCLACFLVTIVAVGNSNMLVPFYWSNLYFKCHLYCYKIVDSKFLLHLLQMFDELHKGTARFSLKISDSCDLCYIVRLLKVITRLRQIMLA